MITKDSIETAYSFLHQKRRSTSGRLLPTGRKNIYIHSTLDWQKDDIELAIGNYVDDMSQELYEAISDGRADFLRDHKRFGEDQCLSSWHCGLLAAGNTGNYGLKVSLRSNNGR